MIVKFEIRQGSGYQAFGLPNCRPVQDTAKFAHPPGQNVVKTSNLEDIESLPENLGWKGSLASSTQHTCIISMNRIRRLNL